ncbi:MAG: zinc ribbon domain-containing protein [Phycisphaerales bacterium]
MGVERKFVQKFNTPAKPDPLPLAQEVEENAAQCPACSVAIRPRAVLCISCGARLGRIDTVAPAGLMSRAPCPGCGYDLSGVSGTKCPECGGFAPFAAVSLDDLTEREPSIDGRLLWEACRPAIFTSVFGLIVLTSLAGAWYGPDGVKFWIAAIIPTWVIASAGYFILGAILRFLDTTIPIALLQVLAVVMLGLAITELVCPYNAGKISITRLLFVVPAVVTLATMLIMDDDDRVQCFLASLPITLACLGVPLVLLAIVG